ncbi:MAG: histidyl-tRNA synthetase, partial [Thermoplasmata archaeon]|nr:histidyl-tRNA synthetase [Thermoplasmata archaeon]
MAEAPPINRPRGTRDFDPAQTAVRGSVAARMRAVFRRFAYREVQTPAFEELALFTAKSGEGVIGELYDFKDKGDRDLCLRPELTAPVMRMYFQDHFNDPKPIKWFYHGACYRYDRPQAGRYREFWQFGCEQIGAGTPLAYAELLALADAVMADVGLQERDFFVGHVKVLKHCVDAFGFAAEARGRLMRAIDKRSDDEIRSIVRAAGGLEPLLEQLFQVMDARSVAEARQVLLVPAALDHAWLGASLDELEQALGH